MLYKADMAFADKLRAARGKAGLRQRDLAEALDISVQAISNWERGENTPEFSRIVMIAKLLDIEVDDLIDDTDEFGKPPQLSTAYWAPLIDRVAAGQWKLIIAEGERPRSTRSFDLGRPPVGEAFALEVESGSMAPEFKEGDVIIIDTGIEPRPGDFVVAKLDRDDKATFKKYRLRGRDEAGEPIIDLVPLNNDYPSLTMDGANPGSIVGVMIEHRRFRR